MTTTQKSMLRVFVLAVLVLALPVAAFAQVRRPAGTPGAPSSPVTVTNTPLPTTATVSGTVNIGNAPSVNVANTPTVNVNRMPSITGAVEVSNAPNVYVANRAGAGAVAVNAAQAGSWNVNVTGMPASSGNVTVVNSSPIQVSGTVALSSGVNAHIVNTDPVPVRLVTPATVTRVHRTFVAAPRIPGYYVHEMYPVPGDRRLVIEYASVAMIDGPAQEVVAFALRTTLGEGSGEAADHYIPFTQSGTSTVGLKPVQVGGGPVRIYANPGTVVRAVVDNYSGGIQTGELHITISGYLEP